MTDAFQGRSPRRVRVTEKHPLCDPKTDGGDAVPLSFPDEKSGSAYLHNRRFTKELIGFNR